MSKTAIITRRELGLFWLSMILWAIYIAYIAEKAVQYDWPEWKAVLVVFAPFLGVALFFIIIGDRKRRKK